ncbi:acyltransferase family protein [Solibacillus sp. CAU 1738]|uniref:acyltransferase family protein n=1 Tax=Solibacillus sp. CAU 1738 TaxID=3140363 RepID=UPI00326138D5
MRDNQIDALKGIGIVYVIIGHLQISKIDYSMWSYIYSFHMPLFFFVSGYLFKRTNAGFDKFISKKAKSILIPYTVLFVISLLFGYLIKPLLLDRSAIPEIDILQIIKAFIFSGGELTTINLYNFPLWFLPCLFLVEILFWMLSKIKRDMFFLGTILLIAAITLPFQMYFLGRPPFHFNVIPAALVFMGIGYLFKKYSKINVPLIFVVTALVSSILIMYNNLGAHIANIKNPINYFTSALLSIMVYYHCVKSISEKNILVWLGRNSLELFGIHSLVIVTYSYLPLERYFGNFGLISFFIFNAINIVIICSVIVYGYKKIKSMNGKKEALESNNLKVT